MNNFGGRVYAILADLPEPAVKIGFSVNPKKRFSSIQSHCPIELRLLGHVSGGRRLEKNLHRAFSRHHIRGEWFRLDGIVKRAVHCIEKQDELALLDVLMPYRDFVKCPKGLSFLEKIELIARS